MDEKQIEQKESIKLTKNAKGDYQWEIKLFQEKIETTVFTDRLKKINEELEEKFGKK